MDNDPSLNQSRPAWDGLRGDGSAHQFSSTSRESWNLNSSTDTSRLGWDENASAPTFDQSHAKDDERVANDVVNNRESRPVDFLKLVGLWASANQEGSAVQDFRADGITSMRASKTLGRGLSFNVSLVRIDDGAKSRLGLRSSFVVYKKLRGLSDTLDVVERGELLRAVLLEVRVLTHPPLRAHNNIANLIQLIWEPDPDNADQAWPTLVLEYAENGTLADFQIDYPNLPFSLRRQLCRDVGNGLRALRDAGIVHGDLKSENVLVFDIDQGEGVGAKLADFGCAVIDLEPSQTAKLPAFTLPWNAPESHDRLPRDILQKTDVYSFGLLVWRIVLDGVNPFRHVPSLAHLDKTDFQRQVEILKMEDQILPMARLTLREPYCKTDEAGIVAKVLDSTLQLDASERDLDCALRLLDGGSAVPIQPLMPYEYDDVDITALAAEGTPMCLQLSIIKELEILSERPGKSGVRACSLLFELYIQRLEWPGAEDSAAKWYIKAVQADPNASIARYAFGVFEILQRPVPPDVDAVSILKSWIQKGCYHSLMELQRRSPSDFPVMLEEFRKRGGLLSRDERHKVKNLASFQDFKSYFDDLSAKNEGDPSELGKMIVTGNDDLLLHAASRHGNTTVMEELLSIGADVNITNADGETALLQACRAGNLEATGLLLSKGADPSIAAGTGETPLHWTFAFGDEYVEEATTLLLSCGAYPCLYATVSPGRSSAVEYLTLYGTPLHYAIQARNERAAGVLLSAGADPFMDHSREREGEIYSYTPFRLAIEELLPSLVQTVVDSPNFASDVKGYFASKNESLLLRAVRSASTTIHRIRLGTAYPSSLVHMISLLRVTEADSNVSGSETSSLHNCIVHGVASEVTEYLLQTGGQEHLELVSRAHGSTPLQVAMQLNRRTTFLLLLEYGADIHRRLLFPEGFSYLQLCTSLGSNALFFANVLLARGAKLPTVEAYDPEVRGDTESLSQFSPHFLAIISGNFELATFLIRRSGSRSIVPPPGDFDLFMNMFRALPRLPVSRLRYLLEPPQGLEAISLEGYARFNRNCFHALTAHPILGDLELLVNFRYLVEQSRLRGQPELINQLDKIGFPPLVGAVMMGRLDLIGEMLPAGADPNLGGSPSVNYAYVYLKRLQKAPSQTFAALGGHTLSRREARWLQDDYKSIIRLLKQYGGREERRANGTLKLPYTGILGGYLDACKHDFVSNFKRGKELGMKTTEQEGFGETMSKIWGALTTKKARSTKPMQDIKFRPWEDMKSNVMNSHMRYQDDIARRNRFASSEGEASGASTTLAGEDQNRDSSYTVGLCTPLDEAKSGLSVPLTFQTQSTTLGSMRDFAKWYTSAPAQEVQDYTPAHPSPSAGQYQGQPHHRKGTSSPFPPTAARTPPASSEKALHASSLPPAQPSYQQTLPSNVNQHLSPINRGNNGSIQHQPSRIVTPEDHMRTLQQLTSTVPLDSSDRQNLIQQCLDTHFASNSVTQQDMTSPGAPLGSLYIFDLEKGLRHLLRGEFDVKVLVKESYFRAIIRHPEVQVSGGMERQEDLVNQGWLGWTDLEEREAEILTRSFGDVVSL